MIPIPVDHCDFWPVFGELRNMALEENREVLERIGEKKTLLNNILRRKANWFGHILRRNYLLHDAIEEHMTELKGVERRRT